MNIFETKKIEGSALRLEELYRFATIFLLGFLLSYSVNAAFAEAPPADIQNYRPIFLMGYDQQQHLLVLIRAYERQGNTYYLTVDSNTLLTRVMKTSDVRLSFDRAQLQETNYFQALKRYSVAPYLLANDGLTHARENRTGVFLTIDLCPSHKPFEKQFFEALVAMGQKEHRPLPIAISVSGLWMLHHQAEMHWLINQEKNNLLQITWINHSFHHPIKDHFLLASGINFEEEVIKTEEILLQQGETPSIFFRFPGLISNQMLISKLTTFGLIAIGSDAWLAKGQKIEGGSIILVHGNSNESLGIKIIMPMLRADQLHFLPLTQAI